MSETRMMPKGFGTCLGRAIWARETEIGVLRGR